MRTETLYSATPLLVFLEPSLEDFWTLFWLLVDNAGEQYL